VAVISPAEAARLARAMADEIASTIEPGTAGLVEELVRRPRTQAHRSILLGHETGWIDLVWRALEVAELADDNDDVAENDRRDAG
jgi:hypothetical protein